MSNTPLSSDIGIVGDRIGFIGHSDNIKYTCNKIIDANGLIVCPGFIDTHTHADRDLNKKETADKAPFLIQGVTTVVVGNDGDRFYPMIDCQKLYAEQGIETNVAILVGHGTIRKMVIGKSDQLASQDEINNTRLVIKKEMEAGAYGISTDLYYAPGSYANTAELSELSKIISEYGGIYDTHPEMRGLLILD